SCPKASPGTCVNEASDWRLPASNNTTLMPRRVSSCASVPPPAPEPMMTTTPSSVRSNFAMRGLSGLFRHRPRVLERHFGQPAQIVEPAEQVAALRERLAFVAEVAVGHLRGIEHAERLHAHRREERRLLDFLQRSDTRVLGSRRE